MYTILNPIQETMVIKKSTFICNVLQTNSLSEANEFINKIKVKYPDARHHCFAYKIGNASKSNDDGEPSSTAGKPILDVLEYNELTNITCVVSRYFGGIKLGAGGLVRAYSNSCSNAISKANIIELLSGQNIDLIFTYPFIKVFDYTLKKHEYLVFKKFFEAKVKYNLNVSSEQLEEFRELVKKTDHLAEIKCIKNVVFTKG